MPQMKPLGYGRTPLDVSIQNWALKYARVYVQTTLHAVGEKPSPIRLGRAAQELIDTEPKWIAMAIKKVMGKNYEPREDLK